MKLPFLSSSSSSSTQAQNQRDSIATSSSSSSSWPWPSCTQTRTLSFRATNDNKNIYKTMNTTFSEEETTPNPKNDTTKNNNEDDQEDRESVDQIESVIRGLTLTTGEEDSRLFFEPGESSSSSILKETSFVVSSSSSLSFKETSFALSMESRNPYLDFKESMAEMVEAHEIDGWDGLEDLLSCFLKINPKDNHGYIIGAFVDLLLGLAFQNNNNKDNNIINDNMKKYCNCNCESPYSPLSFCNTSSSSCSSVSNSLLGLVINSSDDQEIETSCLSSLLETEEEEEEDDIVSSS